MKQAPLPQIPDDPRLKLVRQISHLMDEQFSIAGFRFGLDPLLNFLPVAGDVGSYIVSIALIITMIKHGASGKVAMKMVANATFDALLGAIPILGWIADFTFRANTKNVRLLAEHYTEGKHQGKAGPLLIVILLVFIIAIALITYFGFIFLRWFAHEGDKIIGIKF